MSGARKIHRIMLPIVGSSTESAAIEYAALIARALAASITVVHVDDLPNAMVAMVPGATVDGDLAAEHAASTIVLERAAVQLRDRGVTDVKVSHVISASLGPALVELARSEQIDLIIMATHARTGLARALLGSVAEHAVRHAPCPVMTVHPT